MGGGGGDLMPAESLSFFFIQKNIYMATIKVCRCRSYSFEVPTHEGEAGEGVDDFKSRER